MKEKIKKGWLVTKAIIVIALITIATAILNYFDPQISANMAVNQLEDSYASHAGLSFYQDVKSNFWLIYIILPVLFFFTDIIKLLKGGK